MSLAAGALAFGRRFAATQAASTCRIERITPGSVLDDETGLYVDAKTLVYEGPCELVFSDVAARETTPQSQSVAEQNPVLKLPVEGTASVTVDDVGTLTAHPYDPGMVGLTFRVTGLHTRTFATTRRLPIEVLT